MDRRDPEWEAEVKQAVQGALIEFRLKQVEQEVEEIQRSIATLATKEDLQGISSKLDEAATKAKEAAENTSKRGFEWRKTILGGSVAGIIVAVFTTLLTLAVSGKIHF